MILNIFIVMSDIQYKLTKNGNDVLVVINGFMKRVNNVNKFS